MLKQNLRNCHLLVSLTQRSLSPFTVARRSNARSRQRFTRLQAGDLFCILRYSAHYSFMTRAIRGTPIFIYSIELTTNPTFAM